LLRRAARSLHRERAAAAGPSWLPARLSRAAVAASAGLRWPGSRLVWQVRDSTGPLDQCPAGHLIMAASRGPPVGRMTYRHLTSAGSPHLSAPCWSSQAGQSTNIIFASISHRAWVWVWARRPWS